MKRLHISLFKDRVQARYNSIIAKRSYVFMNHLHKVYAILDYIRANENGYAVSLVHCDEGDGVGKGILESFIATLKETKKYKNLNIDLVYYDKAFEPSVIEEFAHEQKIDMHQIFIGTIHEFHKFSFDELGGVRIISR